MSSISSVSSYASSTSASSTQRMHRPDPSKMAADLFSKLDTKSQGYLEKSDLQSAFDSISGTGSSASVDDIFSQLDSDGDGKVTENEMSTTLKKLADQLDSQFDQMRMSGGMNGMGGMPPPPPPETDTGFTKDELQSQLSEIGSSDSKRSELISKVVNNFDKADSDGDGKVSFKEAMAYDQQNSTSSSASSTASSKSSSSDQALMKKIMELMQAYASDNANQNNLLSTLSVSA